MRRSEARPITAPAAFKGEGGATAAPTRWWTLFEDEGLNGLQTRLLGRNLDLAQAVARADQLSAVAQIAGAGVWPTLSANGGVSRSKSMMRVPSGPGGETKFIENETNMYNASLAAGYEIDLWGKRRHSELAAQADLVGAVRQIQALAITLSATLADAWFSLVAQRAQLVLLKAQVQSNTQLLELVQFRFDNGLTSAVAVLQQREQLARSRTLLPLFEGRIAVLESALAVLVRDVPGGGVPTGAVLPALPPLPKVPVPAQVLAQRPDVAAAQARLASADHRIAVAVAARLPALKLSASVGQQAFELADFLESTIWSIGAQIGGLIWDGGRQSADQARLEAALRERLAAYAAVTLKALKEVEDALVLERQQRAHLEALDAQLRIARQLLEDSQLRYSEGGGDYLPVLTAVRTVQQLEQGRIGAQRQLISYRIALYRALGGDWRQVLSSTPRTPVASTSRLSSDSELQAAGTSH